MKKNNSLRLLSVSTFVALFIFYFVINAQSQNVAITDDAGYTANPSAMLDVKSTSKGMLVPRLTTAQRIAISVPVNGLLVFDTDEGSFYFYSGSSWTNLSSGNANDIWGNNGLKIYANDTTHRVGVGTHSPVGKLEVKGDNSVGINDPLFEVINNSGDTVFAVYSQGVRINIADDPLIKAGSSKGGFAIGGFSISKDITNEYLRVTPDSVRIYIEEPPAVKAGSSKGGFAIGGFSISKGEPTDYLKIMGDNTTEILNPGEPRIYWYPVKQSFLTGHVLVESSDSIGLNSFATGYDAKPIGQFSQALGYHARAFGNNSTAIGNYANAVAMNSYAMGDSAKATGQGSYAFGSVGRDTIGLATTSPSIASGDLSFVIGNGNLSSNRGAFSIGSNNISSGSFSMTLGTYSTASGSFSTAIGRDAMASGFSSISIGAYSYTSGMYSIAMGYNSKANNSYSSALGLNTTADGYGATAIGVSTSASGYGSVAMGYSTHALGKYSTAMGYMTSADTIYSTAMGVSTIASGWGSTALGGSTVASSNYSTAMGILSTASGVYSTAIGYLATASGNTSIAMGREIIAAGNNSFGIGLNNPATEYTITQNNTMAIMGGNVGIGTVSPIAPLHVVGTATLGQAIIAPSITTSGGDAELAFAEDDDNSYNMSIKYNGTTNFLEVYGKSLTTIYGPHLNIGRSSGEVSMPSVYADVVGATNRDLYIDNTGKLGYLSSSKKYKKNIVNMEDIGWLYELRPVNYSYKTDKSKHKEYGLIAEEVEALNKNFVSYNDDGQPETVSYSKFITPIIKALQEQNQINDEQRAEIEQLKAEINELKEILHTASAK